MFRHITLVVSISLMAPVGTIVAQREQPTVEVYKSATCGCCNKWVEHLRMHGFTVHTTNQENLADFKARRSIPRRVQSCHTAVVNGYVLEGHVPASDVHRLLKERPAIVGLAVPGMPIGSPGMEAASGKVERFDVLAFDKALQTRVFASHGR